VSIDLTNVFSSTNIPIFRCQSGHEHEQVLMKGEGLFSHMPFVRQVINACVVYGMDQHKRRLRWGDEDDHALMPRVPWRQANDGGDDDTDDAIHVVPVVHYSSFSIACMSLIEEYGNRRFDLFNSIQ
jgi:hypothetical protein